jgi:hypothetical protein
MKSNRFEFSDDYWLVLCRLVHEGRSGPDDLK